MGELRAAAIFDLDRTLLADSSGLLLMDALVESGLVGERERAIANLTRGFYRRVGETWIGMQITRRSIGRIAGWSSEQLRQAARRALDALDQAVYKEARELIERHRAEGRLVCIATSTGRDIVEPLAERLGVDHLIATEYESDDGKLTGNLIGKWLWGPDKAEAVKQFAERVGIDLDESYAYSDSYYDRHLLEMVGYPRPVNPDPLLRAFAVRKGWPILRFGTDRTPLELYDLLRPVAHRWVFPLDIRTEAIENIPVEGPCIVAANHRSYSDPVVLATIAMRRNRKLRYLGKKEVFDAPVIGQVARALHQIRVDRGTGSGRPVREALDALDRGEAIGIFPQGTIPRGEAFFDPRLRGRTGVARLAAASGAPVIPVALWGTEKVWARSQRIPRPWIGRKRVWARVGEPIYLKGDDVAALTQEVMDTISSLLPEEVRNPSAPTGADIEAATPP